MEHNPPPARSVFEPSGERRSHTHRLEMPFKPMTGAQLVIQSLIDSDVKMFFLSSGGALIAPLCEALSAHVDARVVRLSQERAAVHAAEGYAKATGRMAAVLVSGGSGIAAAVAGLMSAAADSVPLLCLAGQVDSALIGTDAYRECDALGITRPVTKWNRRIASADQVVALVDRASAAARSGRAGPVLLELPIDVQRAHARYRHWRADVPPRLGSLVRTPPERRLAHAAEQLRAARRPLIYAGGGVIRSGPQAAAALAELARVADMPCVLTLSALGALPATDRHLLGCLGEWGGSVANLALRHADLVLCVGARLDERSWPRGDAPPALLVHADIDPCSLNKVSPATIPLVGDAFDVLKGLGQHLLQSPVADVAVREGAHDTSEPPVLHGWWQLIDGWRRQAARAEADRPRLPIVDLVLRALNERLGDADVVIAVDDGLAQAAGARHLRHLRPGGWLVSAGVGMPGFALPAAIGALAAQPRRPVLCLSDANALLPTLHELQSVADHGWPLKLIVFPPPVADLRRSAAACAASPSVMIQRPDIAAIARAFGWRIQRLKSAAAIDRAVAECLASDEPCLLQVDLSLADALRAEPRADPAAAPGSPAVGLVLARQR